MTSLPQKIVVASGNSGKIREIERLFCELDIEVIEQSRFGIVEVDETANTFAGNSLLKAQHANEATGLAAIADDSGLAVDALNGEPGVFSARFSGPDATSDSNIDKLLRELDGIETAQRGASFHCVVTLVVPGCAEPLVASGEWRGSILHERKGRGGFGYDPIFLDTVTGLSAAELTKDQKDARSHRGLALRDLIARIRAW